MSDRSGTGTSLVVTSRDVTAEPEAEPMEGDLIATVSHELLTPLTLIKGLLLSLDQGLIEDTPEARHEYLAIMLRQAERLERLIGGLLEASRIEAGALQMQREPFEIGATLEHAIREAGALSDGNEVRFEQHDHPVWIRGDPVRLDQIVTNLLTNAFKYSRAGAPVDVRLATDGDLAVVSVRDRGDGIPLAEQEHIFDRFYRAGAARTSTASGVGLGLYIAKRLTEAMGGSLTLSSRSGEGSTFSVHLPMLEAPEQGAVPSEATTGDHHVHPPVPMPTGASPA